MATHPSYQKPCGWNALLPQRQGIQQLCDDARCDVAIVGAGYTGVAVARRWAELQPDANILLLDASEIGEGSAGRNSGFLLEIALANDADAAAIGRMRDCNALISSTMEDIRLAVANSPVACRLQRTGTYRAAASATGLRAIDAYKTFLEAAELPFEELNRLALRRRIGTEYYERALYSPHCYLAQPAALIRSLVATLPASVSLFERSPVIRLGRAAEGWALWTPAAAVHASHVVLANNAFAKALVGARSRVATIFTYAGLTEPMDSDFLTHLGSDTNWGLLPALRLGTTLRRTDDGRMLVRSLYGYEAEADNDVIEQKLRDCLARRFPPLANLPFHSVWAGATGFTLNGAPQWGRLAAGLYVSAGCNGGGIVKGTLFGRLLAEYALGREVPDVAALFGTPRWMPPEPFRRFGFRVLAAIEAQRGAAEV